MDSHIPGLKTRARARQPRVSCVDQLRPSLLVVFCPVLAFVVFFLHFVCLYTWDPISESGCLSGRHYIVFNSIET